MKNAKIRAERRLELQIGDDFISMWYPYFGIAIHHAFFGGKVEFHNDTSFACPVIEEACEFEDLKYNLDNIWVKRLKEALLYCREHGEGILLASVRGGNGPLDMANGVMGDNLFTEMIEDEENMHRVMKICMDSCDAMYTLQQECASQVLGGTIAAQGNLWMPRPMFGHISTDAGQMVGPKFYEMFDKPYIEQLAEKYEGFLLHTHMMGWQMYDCFAKTKGIKFIRPVNDPNSPDMITKIDELLELSEEKVLMLTVGKSELAEIVPKLKNRRCVLELQAENPEEAKEQLDLVHNLLEK